MTRRVVITGMGTVNPLARGVAGYWQGLLAGKSGIAPAELRSFLERCPVEVVGLMTMPPLAAAAEDSRPYFAALRALADDHGLSQLSMGTSQDYPVAVSEGATIVRLGSILYASAS